jgi:hypothetical protein
MTKNIVSLGIKVLLTNDFNLTRKMNN